MTLNQRRLMIWKTGTSYVTTLPIKIIRDCGYKVGDEIPIEYENRKGYRKLIFFLKKDDYDLLIMGFLLSIIQLIKKMNGAINH